MENIENYFVNEDELKSRIATGREQLPSDEITIVNPSETDDDIPKIKENKTKKSLHDKVSINDFFEHSISVNNASLPIRLSEEILSRLKVVSFFIKQQEGAPKHSLKSYIENILIQHLIEYEDQISDLKKNTFLDSE